MLDILCCRDFAFISLFLCLRQVQILTRFLRVGCTCAHCRPLPLAGLSTPRSPGIPPAPLVQPQTAVWLQNLVARAAIRTSGGGPFPPRVLDPCSACVRLSKCPQGKKTQQEVLAHLGAWLFLLWYFSSYSYFQKHPIIVTIVILQFISILVYLSLFFKCECWPATINPTYSEMKVCRSGFEIQPLHLGALSKIQDTALLSEYQFFSCRKLGGYCVKCVSSL